LRVCILAATEPGVVFASWQAGCVEASASASQASDGVVSLRALRRLSRAAGDAGDVGSSVGAGGGATAGAEVLDGPAGSPGPEAAIVDRVTASMGCRLLMVLALTEEVVGGWVDVGAKSAGSADSGGRVGAAAAAREAWAGAPGRLLSSAAAVAAALAKLAAGPLPEKLADARWAGKRIDAIAWGGVSSAPLVCESCEPRGSWTTSICICSWTRCGGRECCWRS